MQQFLAAARTAARLRHPGLMAVYDVQVEGECPCIVQELIPGPSLACWRREFPRRRPGECEYSPQDNSLLGIEHGYCYRLGVMLEVEVDLFNEKFHQLVFQVTRYPEQERKSVPNRPGNSSSKSKKHRSGRNTGKRKGGRKGRK